MHPHCCDRISFFFRLSNVPFYMHAHVLSHFGHFFVTPWTVACQSPLSMGFSGQEYWSGLPCPPPRDLPELRIVSYVSCIGRRLACSLHLAPPGKPVCVYTHTHHIYTYIQHIFLSVLMDTWVALYLGCFKWCCFEHGCAYTFLNWCPHFFSECIPRNCWIIW